MDLKLAEARVPIDLLEQEHQQTQNEFNDRIAEAQLATQELNMSVDKLNTTNKAIERYFISPFELAFCLNAFRP